MNTRQHGSPTTSAARTTLFRPVRSGLLQRKCACGGTPGATGECKECSKKRLQRKTTNSELGTRNDSFAPPIVHEVLRSPGQPLDTATRAFMEPRFGHDFSQVQVHLNPQAAQSARAVNAMAYTVGRHVVLGVDNPTFWSPIGRRLVAHELAHVVQQSSSRDSQTQEAIAMGAPNSAAELEAESVSTQIAAGAVAAPLMGNVAGNSLQRAVMAGGCIARDDDASREARRQIDEARRHLSQPGLPPEQIAALQARIVQAESALGNYRRSLCRGGGSTAMMATTTTNPVGAIVAGLLLLAAALFASAATRTDPRAAQELARALERLGEAMQLPRLPDLSSAVRILQAATAATVLAMASSIADGVQQVTDAIEEFVRNNPRLGMRCSSELIAFREASRRALEVLANPRQFGDLGVLRAIDAFKSAVNALAACLGLAPIF